MDVLQKELTMDNENVVLADAQQVQMAKPSGLFLQSR